MKDYGLLRTLKGKLAEVEALRTQLLATRRNLQQAEEEEDFDLCEVRASARVGTSVRPRKRRRSQAADQSSKPQATALEAIDAKEALWGVERGSTCR